MIALAFCIEDVYHRVDIRALGNGTCHHPSDVRVVHKRQLRCKGSVRVQHNRNAAKLGLFG